MCGGGLSSAKKNTDENHSSFSGQRLGAVVPDTAGRSEPNGGSETQDSSPTCPACRGQSAPDSICVTNAPGCDASGQRPPRSSKDKLRSFWRVRFSSPADQGANDGVSVFEDYSGFSGILRLIWHWIWPPTSTTALEALENSAKKLVEGLVIKIGAAIGPPAKSSHNRANQPQSGANPAQIVGIVSPNVEESNTALQNAEKLNTALQKAEELSEALNSAFPQETHNWQTVAKYKHESQRHAANVEEYNKTHESKWEEENNNHPELKAVKEKDLHWIVTCRQALRQFIRTMKCKSSSDEKLVAVVSFRDELNKLDSIVESSSTVYIPEDKVNLRQILIALRQNLGSLLFLPKAAELSTDKLMSVAEQKSNEVITMSEQKSQQGDAKDEVPLSILRYHMQEALKVEDARLFAPPELKNYRVAHEGVLALVSESQTASRALESYKQQVMVQKRLIMKELQQQIKAALKTKLDKISKISDKVKEREQTLFKQLNTLIANEQNSITNLLAAYDHVDSKKEIPEEPLQKQAQLRQAEAALAVLEDHIKGMANAIKDELNGLGPMLPKIINQLESLEIWLKALGRKEEETKSIAENLSKMTKMVKSIWSPLFLREKLTELAAQVQSCSYADLNSPFISATEYNIGDPELTAIRKKLVKVGQLVEPVETLEKELRAALVGVEAEKTRTIEKEITAFEKARQTAEFLARAQALQEPKPNQPSKTMELAKLEIDVIAIAEKIHINAKKNYLRSGANDGDESLVEFLTSAEKIFFEQVYRVLTHRDHFEGEQQELVNSILSTVFNDYRYLEKAALVVDKAKAAKEQAVEKAENSSQSEDQEAVKRRETEFQTFKLKYTKMRGLCKEVDVSHWYNWNPQYDFKTIAAVVALSLPAAASPSVDAGKPSSPITASAQQPRIAEFEAKKEDDKLTGFQNAIMAIVDAEQVAQKLYGMCCLNLDSTTLQKFQAEVEKTESQLGAKIAAISREQRPSQCTNETLVQNLPLPDAVRPQNVAAVYAALVTTKEKLLAAQIKSAQEIKSALEASANSAEHEKEPRAKLKDKIEKILATQPVGDSARKSSPAKASLLPAMLLPDLKEIKQFMEAMCWIEEIMHKSNPDQKAVDASLLDLKAIYLKIEGILPTDSSLTDAGFTDKLELLATKGFTKIGRLMFLVANIISDSGLDEGLKNKYQGWLAGGPKGLTTLIAELGPASELLTSPCSFHAAEKSNRSTQSRSRNNCGLGHR